VLAYLHECGVIVRQIDAFDHRSPHCNKISALQAITAESSGHVALTDCDIIFLSDPRELIRDPSTLQAKPVDAPNPPLVVLATILEARGLPLGETQTLQLFPNEATCVGNANGGLYVGEASWLNTLAADWRREAEWLLEHRALLQGWAVHVDQVSMLLALRAGHRRFCPLPLGANLPTHLPEVRDMPADAVVPILAIHYHDHVTPQGILARTGIPQVDVAVDRANESIRAEMGAFFPNATFWAWRYQRDADLGSGIGSRGRSLEEKRDLIGLMAAALEPASTLDVGCGDGSAVSGLELGAYLGLDLAPNAGGRLSDGKAVACRSVAPGDTADMVLCLDVGIHQSDREKWERLVTSVVDSAQSLALVSGYEQPPDVGSPMVHFHEPLSEVLERHGPEWWRLPAREDQGVVTFLVMRSPAPHHPRDLERTTASQLPLDLLLGPELGALLACAWKTTGFYPNHLPRMWEYPAVLRVLRQTIAAGGSVLDVGAGVNPLVPMLRKLGYRVTTIDSGPEVCPPEERERWIEWGYLDYAELGLDIESVNGTLADLPQGVRYDAVVSISVIEHLAAIERRAMLAELRRRCRRDGRVVLTVDVCAGSDRLWNRSAGREVESFGEHGRWHDLLSELSANGLETVEARIVPLAGRCHVDVGYVVARPRVSVEAE
jgi:SAM-dependent methyltransferase